MTSIADHLASRKLSVEKAAEKAGMTSERLEQVLAGAEASLSEMRAVAKALRVPLSSLMDREAAEPIKMLFRQTLDQRAVEVSSHVDVLSGQVRDALAIARGMPSNLNWLEAFNGLEAKYEAAEIYAQRFRETFAALDDKEPFQHLSQALNELGVFVLFSRDSSIEGVSAIVDGYALMILGARRFKPRLLFTMGHELGHLVAHHDKKGGYAHLDQVVDIDESHGRSEERFADAFASALLLPRAGVLLTIQALREQFSIRGPLGDFEICWLAHIYGASFEVAAKRCEDMKLIPSRGARAFYQKILESHKNPEQWAQELGIPERPDIPVSPSTALLRAAALKVKAGEISVGRAAELLNVPVSSLYFANSEIRA
ncbi:MAG: ImmA/IrrE family metallo-endopeptidase [Proteobacteria bacterium]|nr:ImmA/IrrE family metallo-endopeptidase [Pseudomonadota bacterium]